MSGEKCVLLTMNDQELGDDSLTVTYVTESDRPRRRAGFKLMY